MKTRALLSLSLSALTLGGSMVGCAATGQGGLASAGDRNAAAVDRQSAAEADRASRALAKGDADEAVRHAEAAVTLAPRQLGYRTVLANSYLKAGRFTSADQAFGDVLALSPDQGEAALHRALAQTALGRWADARRTLDANADRIAPSDRGLAMALAGDPLGGVEVLMAAVRSPDATVKARQNLALALALSGRWQQAKAVAAIDLAPADLDKRIMEWAAFARPSGAGDQVATLLGVVPVADSGRPVALALTAPAAVVAVETPPAAAAVAVAVPAEIPAAPARPAAASWVPHEVVQPLPVETAATRPAPARPAARQAVAAAWQPSAGNWFVQLGAYDNAAVAQDGWSRAQRRYATLRGRTPTGVPFTSNGTTFYRLSVGGFVRGDADRLCRAYRQSGGACFVRQAAGDQLARWVRKDVQVASR